MKNFFQRIMARPYLWQEESSAQNEKSEQKDLTKNNLPLIAN